MRIDGNLSTTRIDRTPERVRELERLGFDGAFTFEDDHEPFSALLVAARRSQHLELTTAIADAFSRDPKALAAIGRELHVQSGGRFRLGLGSMQRGRPEELVDVEEGGSGELAMAASGSVPDERMRRLVLGLKAIWARWDDEASQDEVAGGRPIGGPPVLVRSHGPRMAQMAGQVADGIVLSPFHTVGFLTGTTLPAVERGRARRTALRGPFDVVCQVLVVTGSTSEERAAAVAMARRQIAYEALATGHRGVLESEGWSGLHAELNTLFREGHREAMVACIDDEMLDRLAVCGPPQEIAERLGERYEGRATRLAIRSPQCLSADTAGCLLESFEQEWEVDPLAS